MHVLTLSCRVVQGLAALVFPDQPSLCLVSNGAECMFIDKRFYMDNCPPELSRRLKTEVSSWGHVNAAYWAVQRSWFARMNALRNLSSKKSKNVAAATSGLVSE